MIARVVLLLSLSFVTACANNNSNRRMPAPVESRDNSAVTTPSPVIDELDRNSAIIRDEVPVDIAPPAAPVSGISSPSVPSTPATPATPSAILLASVDEAVAQGDLERAAALCERALRINPRDALLWYRLATIRADQGRASEAEGIARRALSYSTSNPSLTQQINALINRL